MIRNLFVFTILFALCSCASYTGSFNDSASLSGGNFEISGWGQGQSSAKYLFGIGGLNKEQLVFEAKKDLYENYPLQKGQSYANVSVDFKTLFVLPYIKRTATINADIVQFYPETASSWDSSLQSIFKELSPVPVQSTDTHIDYSVGDRVYSFVHGVVVKGVIIDLDSTMVQIEFVRDSNNLNTKQPFSKVFSTDFSPISSSLKENQMVFYNEGKQWSQGGVVGYNSQYFLITVNGSYLLKPRNSFTLVNETVFFDENENQISEKQNALFKKGEEVFYMNEGAKLDAIFLSGDKDKLVFVDDSNKVMRVKSKFVFSKKEPFNVEGLLLYSDNLVNIQNQSKHPMKVSIEGMNEDFVLIFIDDEYAIMNKKNLKFK